MGLTIRIGGTASLREFYKNYYAVVSATVEARGADKYVQPPININVQITEEQYEGLKRRLSESKPREPVLRVDGNLELSL